MTKTQTVEINDKTFYITPFGAFEALPLLGDLQKQILPAVAALVKDNDEDSIDYEAAARSIGAALSGAELVAWSKRLITPDNVSVEHDGDAKKLNTAVANAIFTDPFEILELMVQVIMVNFKDPLARSLSRFGLGDKVKAKFSQSVNSETI